MEDIYSGRESVQEEVCVAPEVEEDAAVAVSPAVSPAEEVSPEQATVGFWAYFGLALLFAVPVFGWIACVLMAFLPKRKSLKNYARATLAWLVIGIVTLAVLVSALSRGAAAIINSTLDTEFASIGEIVDLAKGLQSGDYSVICTHLAKQAPAEYRPLLEELGSGEYTELFHKVKQQDYSGILSGLENGEYAELVSKVDDATYAKLEDGLKDAKDGTPPDALKAIEELSDMDATEMLTKLPDLMKAFS